LHHLYGLVLGDFENVEQCGLRFTILNKLDDFVDATGVGADVEDLVLLVQYFYVNSATRNEKSGKRENSIMENSFVH